MSVESLPRCRQRANPHSNEQRQLPPAIGERYENEKAANSGSRNRWRDLLLRISRDDKTAIELFLIGVRALALQSSIIDVVRIASRFSTATG
jgi:hypothetical protein